MPLVLGGSSAAAGAFTAENSCRFNDDDSAMLEITPASTTDAIRKTWTFSVWFKLGNLGAQAGTRRIIFPRADGSNYSDMWLQADDTLRFNDWQTGSKFNFITNQVFMDPTAWQHLVVAMDTTIASPEADRTKIYHNGTQITSFSTESYPAQDTVCMMNSDSLTRIGNDDGSTYFDGYFSQIAMVTGAQLEPTSFGEFDSDSPGSWKPIDISGLTFGTNGYFLDFADSAALGDDVSGNGNDWTPSGLAAADQATDTPSNNFCTLNSLISRTAYPPTYSEGSCKISTNGDWGSWPGTLGAMRGKWYWEVICFGSLNVIQGVISEIAAQLADGSGTGYLLGGSAQYAGVGYSKTGVRYPGSGNTTNAGYFNTYANGDVLGVAMDLDNGKLYFSKDNVWENSGDPTSGATGTGSASDLVLGLQFYFPAVGPYNSTDGFQCNFGGCPAFAITSAESDANEYGAFEYAPPTGYYALCTKNLAEFG